jgi:SAM-dependent methyltransferase
MERLQKADYIHGGTQKDFYEETEREICACLLCGSETYTTIDTDRGLGVVRCKACGLIYTNPRPKDAEQNYFGDAGVFYNEAALIFKGKRPHHRDGNYRYEVKQIRKVKPQGRLLDVGTNMGFFLRIAREAGYETEGVEPSPALSQIAREQWGLKIHTCFLQDAPLQERSYDIITMIDVFEHVTRPKDILQKCASLIKDDGIVVVKVPNGDYNYFKMKLSKMSGDHASRDIWDCCEHVAHYNYSTFKKMIEQSGFELIKWFIPLPIHPPVWAKLVGHYYQYPSPPILDWKNRWLRKLFYATGRIEKIFSKKVYFGPDLMFVIRKKKGS